MSDCRFGVVRENGEFGHIKVFWPDGGDLRRLTLFSPCRKKSGFFRGQKSLGGNILRTVHSRYLHEFKAEGFKMRRRRPMSAKSLLFTLLCVIVVPAVACAMPPVNTDERGVAVKGYDVVAYFTDGKAAEGRSEFAFEWKGATWWFSNRRHLELFQGDPGKYAPQYGGY